MDLLLHVGLPKTGTTTVQNFFCINQDELLKRKIFYPYSNRSPFNQHVLIPILLMKDCWRPEDGRIFPAAFNYLKNVNKNELNINYQLESLKKDLDKYNPPLTIMSSELWSHVSYFSTECYNLISQIEPLFDKITIFVSKRQNFNNLALCATKFHARRTRMLKYPEMKYEKKYFNVLKGFKKKYNFWENLGLPFITKNLEDASGNLVDHYFGDIVKEYSEDARLILQNYDEEILNRDIYYPCDYLCLFLFLYEKKTFEFLKKFVSSNKETLKQTTNEQLILYFEYFEKKYEENDLDNITWEDKMYALKFAKILE
jgi:hypothetical protein